MTTPAFPTPAQTAALARELGLAECVCRAVAAQASALLPDECREEIHALIHPQTAEQAYDRLAQRFAQSDPDGMKMLTVYLAAACLTRSRYAQLGFSDALFLCSFGCIRRFIDETHRAVGRYAFDRAFWAWRQLSCLLFRLGALEFEYRLVKESEAPIPGAPAGTPILSVHIPSDAVLSQEALQDSYTQAAHFFARQGACICAHGSPQRMMCGSWLLSPELQSMLDEASGIRRFAKDYTIYAVDPDNESFYEWLFEKKKDPAEMPQKTSLQRKAAAHLAKGGRLGSARGIKEDFRLIAD